MNHTRQINHDANSAALHLRMLFASLCAQIKMFEDSVIRKTGQWWKFHVFFWGEVTGGFIMFYGLANLENKEIGLAYSLSGMGIGIVSFIFGCVFIRCPNCKAPWLWLGVSGKNTSEWLHWLLTHSECPKCKNEKNT